MTMYCKSIKTRKLNSHFNVIVKKLQNKFANDSLLFEQACL